MGDPNLWNLDIFAYEHVGRHLFYNNNTRSDN